LRATLERADFSDVRVVEDEHDFIYKNQEEVWQSLWTYGARDSLNKMDNQALESFRAAFDDRIKAYQQEDGIHILLKVLHGLGTRK
jgi:hypothetical protein